MKEAVMIVAAIAIACAAIKAHVWVVENIYKPCRCAEKCK